MTKKNDDFLPAVQNDNLVAKIESHTCDSSSSLNDIGGTIVTTINGKAVTMDVNQDYWNNSIYVTWCELEEYVKENKTPYVEWVYRQTSAPTTASAMNYIDRALCTVYNSAGYLTSLYQKVGSAMIGLPLGLLAPLTKGGLKADSNGKLYIDLTDAAASIVNSIMNTVGANLGFGLKYVNGKIQVNTDEIATVDGVNAIQQQITNDFNAAFSDLNDDLGSLSSTVDKNKAEQQQALKDAQAQAAANLSSAQTSLKNEFQAAQAETNAAIGNIANTLTNQLDKNKTDTDSAISNVQGQVDATKKDQAALKEDTKNLSNALSSYTTSVNNALKSLRDDLDALNTNLTKEVNSLSKKTVPIGGIIMWSGEFEGRFPVVDGVQNAYWVLCDGGSSGNENLGNTPNLSGKFIKGRGSTNPTTKTGGSNTHTHTASTANSSVTLPAHTHGINAAMYPGALSPASGISGFWYSEDPLAEPEIAESSAVSGGSHNHTVTVNSANNEPEYYLLAFIMRKA